MSSFVGTHSPWWHRQALPSITSKWGQKVGDLCKIQSSGVKTVVHLQLCLFWFRLTSIKRSWSFEATCSDLKSSTSTTSGWMIFLYRLFFIPQTDIEFLSRCESGKAWPRSLERRRHVDQDFSRLLLGTPAVAANRSLKHYGFDHMQHSMSKFHWIHIFNVGMNWILRKMLVCKFYKVWLYSMNPLAVIIFFTIFQTYTWIWVSIEVALVQHALLRT